MGTIQSSLKEPQLFPQPVNNQTETKTAQVVTSKKTNNQIDKASMMVKNRVWLIQIILGTKMELAGIQLVNKAMI